MHIVQISAEFSPIAKTGGLGEVLLGLTRELTSLGCDVEVILPKYRSIQLSKLPNLHLETPDFKCLERGQNIANAMWSTQVEDCNLHLLEARHPSGYFYRDEIYGYPDDAARFLYFSRAVLEYLKIRGRPIDVLHIHDWHTAACAPLYRALFQKELLIKAIVLTIHNLEYQGKCAVWDLDAIGLNGPSYLKKTELQDEIYPNTINLLKGGIRYADYVTTVSPSYAKEILSPQMGFGLDSHLKQVDLKGILNGIDTTIWNPSTDPHLLVQYSGHDSVEEIFYSKKLCKQDLQQKLGLQCLEKPLIGAIMRLVPQKGTHLVEEAIEEILALGGCFILLGSPPIAQIQPQFERLLAKYQNHPSVFLQYNYEDELAHQIYGSLDFLISPSLFEPCGLTQLIALRYGALPIARATGGLKDTVFDWEDHLVPLEKRNGFIFQDPTAEGIRSALRRALPLWTQQPSTYQSIAQRGMRQDLSWEKPAKEYIKLYADLLNKLCFK